MKIPCKYCRRLYKPRMDSRSCGRKDCKRKALNEYKRKYEKEPEHREKNNTNQKRWYYQNLEKCRKYQRDMCRKKNHIPKSKWRKK